MAPTQNLCWGSLFPLTRALCSAIISGVLLLLLLKSKSRTEKKYTLLDCGISGLNGALNRVANFFLVIALVTVDASVQYPLITGGVMIVSTLINLFSKNKPSKKELIAVGLAFLGTLALFVIPV